jgi:hypothetical protein
VSISQPLDAVQYLGPAYVGFGVKTGSALVEQQGFRFVPKTPHLRVNEVHALL